MESFDDVLSKLKVPTGMAWGRGTTLINGVVPLHQATQYDNLNWHYKLYLVLLDTSRPEFFQIVSVKIDWGSVLST